MRISDWSSDVCSSDLFLKRAARAEIGSRAREKAARIDRRVGRLSLRDTRTSWGSCNSKGDLNFSWRLILAPEHVLDYVVAHEVAHMVHLNHSQRFWKLAGTLTQDMRGATLGRASGRERVCT